MAKHRSHSIEFKRQVAQEFIAGETLHALVSGMMPPKADIRADMCRNVRLSADIVEKVEIGMTAFFGSACVEAASPQSIAS